MTERFEPPPGESWRYELLWHALGLPLLCFGSSLLAFGELPWTTPHLSLLLGLGAGYSLGALALLLSGSRRRHPLFSLALTLAVLAALYLALLLFPSVQYSRRLLLIGSGLLAVLLLSPRFRTSKASVRVSAAAGGLLAVGALLAILLDSRLEEPAPASARSIESRLIMGSQHIMQATRYSGYFPPPDSPAVVGGGLVAVADGYLLVRGRGDLYHARWDEKDSLRVRRLGFDVPINARAFRAETPSRVTKERFRVANLLVLARGDSLLVLATHHYWRSPEECYVVRERTTEPRRGR